MIYLTMIKYKINKYFNLKNSFYIYLLQRVPAGIDILNEIWASSEARAYFIFQANNGENICATGVPSYVDELLELIQHLYKSKNNPPPEIQENSEPKSCNIFQSNFRYFVPFFNI